MARKNKCDDVLLVSILSYLIIGIIWYFLDDDAKTSLTKFHVKQALNILLISIILNILFDILNGVTFGFLIILEPIYLVIQVILFVLWVIGIIYAAQTLEKEIPIIGKFAKKYLKF